MPESFRHPSILRLRHAVFACAVLFGLTPGVAQRGAASGQATAGSAAAGQVVGYYPQWGVYGHYFMGDLVRSGAAASLTQLNYSQAVIRDNACAIADPQADMLLPYPAQSSVDGLADDPAAPLRGNFHQLQLLRRRLPRLRQVISIEGKRSLFEDAGRPENRVAFVRSCVDMFLRGHLAPGVEAPALFDGIDVDWEYPDQQHAEDFIALLAEFRRQMDAVRPGLVLSIAAGAAQKQIDAVDWRRVVASVDQIGMMTYDYNGPWSHTTGFVAPLRSADLNAETAGTTTSGFLSAGVPAAKLLLGVPFYAYEWTGVPAGTTHGLGQNGSAVRGNLNQATAQALLAVSPDARVYRDPVSQAPWIYDGEEFLTYEDTTSLQEKVRFAREKGLGGAMVWELSGDTPDAQLLRALQPLRAPLPPATLQTPQKSEARKAAEPSAATGAVR